MLSICKDHITTRGSEDLHYQNNRKGKTQSESCNLQYLVLSLSSDNKKALASIGRESEKSSKDNYEGIHDEMTRKGLFFPFKRKS